MKVRACEASTKLPPQNALSLPPRFVNTCELPPPEREFSVRKTCGKRTSRLVSAKWTCSVSVGWLAKRIETTTNKSSLKFYQTKFFRFCQPHAENQTLTGREAVEAMLQQNAKAFWAESRWKLCCQRGALKNRTAILASLGKILDFSAACATTP